MRRSCIILLAAFAAFLSYGQEMPVEYSFGEKYNDRYKYSNLSTISEDGTGGYILVRSYYSGMILKPKGYFIERYNKDLELINEFNYKLKGPEFVEGYVKNGQLYMLFLNYDFLNESYDYVVHRSPIDEFNFTEEKLLSVQSQPVRNALDKNYYNRNFNSGFTTTALFADDKSAFVISTHFKKGKTNKHHIYVYNASLKKLVEHDFSAEVEDKNYAFENISFSRDLQTAYIVGKAYFKKKRFTALERKFQYELIKVNNQGAITQTFDEAGKYSEGLKPVMRNGSLICVGFYADRKDNRYNGIAYFELDPGSLNVRTKKYNPFSDQFMFDKFGKDNAERVKDLVFKNVSFTEDNAVLFNAEEYFVTNSVQANSSGGRIRVERFHHNDIVSAKIDASGKMLWARNINKAEVTQGDGSYASYSSYTKDGKTYFFICTASENPQLLNNERLIFKQGLSRNRNVFVILLDEQGKLSYEKIIDNQEARLPLMVSKPLANIQNDEVLFYAKRGTKKQLVNVSLR